MIRSISIPAFTVILCATSVASAQRRSPPPEALEACEGRSAGAACSLDTPHGTLEGTCEAPEGRALACRPAHPPGPPPDGEAPPDGARRGPPPEALSACVGRAAESACVLVTDGLTLDGFCHAPEGRALACVPPHHGMLPGAIEACEGITVGDACVLDAPDGALEGRCRSGPEGIACLPPPPPRTSGRDA